MINKMPESLESFLKGMNVQDAQATWDYLDGNLQVHRHRQMISIIAPIVEEAKREIVREIVGWTRSSDEGGIQMQPIHAENIMPLMEHKHIDDAIELGRIREIVEMVSFQDYTFVVEKSKHGFIYLQGQYQERDTVTNEISTQYTRRWAISPMMSKSEIVSTAFKCVMTSMEHKAREWFLYQGKAIFHPHYDVDDLADICETRVFRGETV